MTYAWRPCDQRLYAYCLGQYLGDGHISFSKRTNPFLRLYMDRAYPGLVSEAATALATLFPEARVRRYDVSRARMTIVQLFHAALPYVFPHGPGQKHTRRITLEAWQLDATRLHPEAFLRGLIHSDGCRTVNRFDTLLPSGRLAHYEYPRYFFSNLSADIRGLFCEHCELLGIRWTQSNPRNISVSHRDSVALLDRFVGPKA